MSSNRNSRSVPTLIACWVLLATAVGAQDNVQQWRAWEKTINSSVDFWALGGNPYRDLVLRVRFTKRGAGGVTFTQDAFWDADTTAPRRFRVRSAFPPGTWDWVVESCTGSTGGRNCAVGTTWTPSSGWVSVVPNTSSGVNLYDRGFLMQSAFVVKSFPGWVHSYSELRYGDGVTPFFWAGDTAWAAPPREIKGQTSAWFSGSANDYVHKRRSQGFTVVLVSPAVAWQPNTGDQWPPLPAASNFSFVQSGSCPAPIPNDCSRPKKSYWDSFDAMVKNANDQDLLVGIAGVMDPVGLGSAGTRFPNLTNAEDFARYLAARMAGHHVVFSPAFDTRTDLITFDQLKTTRDVMNAVGPVLKAAAPRHLVTNHLAGRSTCPDYKEFATTAVTNWMTFYAFQSGHGGTVNGNVSQVCPGRLSSEDSIRSSLRRAREMPLVLRSYTSPVLPNFNAEGPYDSTGYTTNVEPVDTRYRTRHGGYLSSLSSSLGFTYGSYKLAVWDQPAGNIDLPSALDMRRLADRFRSRAGIPARHSWILNQTADPSHETKMVLASNGSSLVIAYLAGKGRGGELPVPPEIAIGRTASNGLSTLSCTGWTIKWINPANNALSNPTSCTRSSDRVILRRPTCVSGDCDWVLEMLRTGSALAGPTGEDTSESLEVWADLSRGDGSSVINARIVDTRESAQQPEILVSDDRRFFQQSPRVARVATGHYLVVWEADGPDGSLEGVFAQRLHRDGGVVGAQVLVNTTTAHSQREPAIASDALGNAVVAWSSYGQDGDQGGIFAQRFDSEGARVGGEMQISVQTAGHQSKPQLGVDTQGRFVVAWGTDLRDDVASSVSARFFDRDGAPLSDEVVVAMAASEHLRLVDLQVTAAGPAVVRWAREDLTGETIEQLEQELDPTVRVPAPSEEVPP